MYSMKEVAGLFGVSVSTMTEYVKNHLAEINADGASHATQKRGRWVFDDEGVQRLAEMRGQPLRAPSASSAAIKNEVTVGELLSLIEELRSEVRRLEERVVVLERQQLRDSRTPLSKLLGWLGSKR